MATDSDISTLLRQVSVSDLLPRSGSVRQQPKGHARDSRLCPPIPSAAQRPHSGIDVQVYTSSRANVHMSFFTARITRSLRRFVTNRHTRWICVRKSTFYCCTAVIGHASHSAEMRRISAPPHAVRSHPPRNCKHFIALRNGYVESFVQFHCSTEE